jgi:hypothetical protein
MQVAFLLSMAISHPQGHAAEAETIRFAVCNAQLPLPDHLYSGTHFESIMFGKRTATPLSIYRMIAIRNEKDPYAPISLKAYWPSFRGNLDDTVPRKERESIFILVFSVEDWHKIPEDASIATGGPNPKHNLRREFSLNPPGLTITRWELQEMAGREGLTGSYFYQPVDRTELLHGIPTFECSSSITATTQFSCTGRAVAKPDFYVAYTFPQRLLSCWRQVEAGVLDVVRLNMTISRTLTSPSR